MKNMKKWLLLASLTAATAFGLFILFSKNSKNDSANDDRQQIDISWSDAEKLIDNCQVTDITYLGGLTADGLSPDEGLAKIRLKDGSTKITEPDPMWDMGEAQQRCGTRVIMP